MAGRNEFHRWGCVPAESIDEFINEGRREGADHIRIFIAQAPRQEPAKVRTPVHFIVEDGPAEGDDYHERSVRTLLLPDLNPEMGWFNLLIQFPARKSNPTFPSGCAERELGTRLRFGILGVSSPLAAGMRFVVRGRGEPREFPILCGIGTNGFRRAQEPSAGVSHGDLRFGLS